MVQTTNQFSFIISYTMNNQTREPQTKNHMMGIPLEQWWTSESKLTTGLPDLELQRKF